MSDRCDCGEPMDTRAAGVEWCPRCERRAAAQAREPRPTVFYTLEPAHTCETRPRGWGAWRGETMATLDRMMEGEW